MSQINKIINKFLGFQKFEGCVSQYQFYMKILKSPIDFKSFLKVAHEHVLYGKNTRRDRGRAHKHVKKSYTIFCNLFRVLMLTFLEREM